MFIRYNAIAKIWEYDSTSLVNDPDSRVGDGKAPWLPLPIDYSQIYNPPTIPPAYVLPANVAKTDVNNNFVAQTLATGSSITGANSILAFFAQAAVANNKVWRVINYGDGLLRFERLNDDSTAILYSSYFDTGGFVVGGRLAVSGHISERSRAVNLGEWQDNPSIAADFTADTGTWTINAIQVNRYTLIGKTIIWCMAIPDSVLSNPNGGVYIKLPGGFSFPNYINMGASDPGFTLVNGVVQPTVLVSCIASSNRLRLLNPVGAGFPAGNLNVYFTFIGEIA